MSENWKPGDMGSIDSRGDDARMMWTGSTWIAANGALLNRYLNPRLLVVIDPVAITGPDETGDDGDPLVEIASCLRRLAKGDHKSSYRRRVAERLAEVFDPTQPPPEEPTGLGAVVRATCTCEGPSVFVYEPQSDRFEGRPGGKEKPWKSHCGHHVWADLGDITILSEGVTP